jgi:hypothetical protein
VADRGQAFEEGVAKNESVPDVVVDKGTIQH